MGMPGWWAERRYGIYFDVSLATVPAWSPIGAPAERYRRHLGETTDGTEGSTEPLVEVLAHHRDRWDHIGSYDDFAPLLTFDDFDAESWAEFVVRCGAGYAAMTAKHHDGWCWWDAAHASPTMVDVGPRRNVLAEFATACERNDLVFGAFYSLDQPSSAVVPEERVDQLRDLIGRLGAELLFADVEGPLIRPRRASGDGTAAPAKIAGSGNPLDDVVLDFEIGELLGTGPAHRITTYAHDPPRDIEDGPWQLCRPVGSSLCHNRTERNAHQMSAVEIATTLTEVIAKGGNLLLGIGPTVDGIISGPGREPLLEAADWIRGHDNLLRGARPWTTWGDADAHYWTTDGALYVADIGGRGRLGLLGSTDHVVERVVQASPAIASADAVDDAGLPFERDEHGIRLSTTRRARRDAGRFPIVYRVEMSARAPAVELFEPAAPMTIPLAPLVDGVEPGSIVQLGDAVYGGPATVPTGVTLRGLGPERTRVTTHGGPVSLDSEARLEHLALALSADRHPADSDTGAADTGEHRPGGAAVRLAVEGDRTTVLGCAIEGLVTVTADAVRIRATRLDRLRASDAHHLRVSHCRFAGDRWTTAVEIVGGGDGEIDSCEFTGYRRAIRIVESTGAAIAGNHIESRHCGVLLERADHAHVHGNLVISTMRAVDVDGGSQAVIDGNAVFDGDSGCVVRGGAAGCEISGNHWERCRIGVLGWNAGWVHETENHSLDLHEPEHVFLAGP